jgi:hypothetical protein
MSGESAWEAAAAAGSDERRAAAATANQFPHLLFPLPHWHPWCTGHNTHGH